MRHLQVSGCTQLRCQPLHRLRALLFWRRPKRIVRQGPGNSITLPRLANLACIQVANK